MDYYLKAENEQVIWSVLEQAGAAVKYDVKDENGDVLETRYSPAQGYSLDIVGVISKPTGNMIQQKVGEETIEVPEMKQLEGFHANLRGPADIADKYEYVQYQPTDEELADPEFVMPDPTVNTIESPIKSILIDAPKSPVRVWA